MTIYCEYKGCGRPANILFSLGERIEKCKKCGTIVTKRIHHKFCFEHAYLFLKEEHEKTLLKNGYLKQTSEGLRPEKIKKVESQKSQGFKKFPDLIVACKIYEMNRNEKPTFLSNLITELKEIIDYNTVIKSFDSLLYWGA